LAIKFHAVKQLHKHPAIAKPRAVYARHRYSTPMFVLRETLYAFFHHNGLGLSASLSFYAMFALIPMALLLFFILSHLVISSDYAIVKLAIVTSNLVPKLSSSIMVEVYKVSQHKAVWGAFGIFALFWVATPLAAALRNAFHTISSIVETPSFIKRKFKDALAVMGILLMIFIFTFSGLVLDALIHYLNPSAKFGHWLTMSGTLLITTLLICAFYKMFYPSKVTFQHLFLGALVTALLWQAMRPAFAIFLSFNESYGSMFGGMKNLFISIGWLYYTFAVFLVGTVLISTLRKKDVLLLRPLFTELPKDKYNYLQELMARFGKVYYQDECVFKNGETGNDLYYLVSGKIALMNDDQHIIRALEAGDYFGEMAVLTESPRFADAVVKSKHAEVVKVSAENIETLLAAEPQVAMRFLRQLASRLRATHNTVALK
jgi:membrane protein